MAHGLRVAVRSRLRLVSDLSANCKLQSIIRVRKDKAQRPNNPHTAHTAALHLSEQSSITVSD